LHYKVYLVKRELRAFGAPNSGSACCGKMSFDSRRSGDRRSRLFDFLPACISSAFVENFPPMPPPRKIPARQRVLAQWRGVDLSPLETAKVVRARAAGDVVSNVLKDLHIDDRRAEAELVKVWNSLIDPNITAHAQPANLRKGTLFVNVHSSVWLSEIVRYRRKEILDRLQHSFGRNLIQKISYRVG